MPITLRDRAAACPHADIPLGSDSNDSQEPLREGALRTNYSELSLQSTLGDQFAAALGGDGYGVPVGNAVQVRDGA